MIKYSNGYIEEYLKEIESNKIIAGNEILHILHNLISDMKSDDFVYDTTDADRRMGFIEGCLRLTKSPFYQKPFKLMLWQKAFISALYGFYMKEDGTQRFRKACLLIARKNGKLVNINTIIDTPSGRKLFKDIHEGDYVFGHDGKPVKVLWESDIQYDDTYRITFEDGEEIIAGASHNWSVISKNTMRMNKYYAKSNRKRPLFDNMDDLGCIVKTTKELYDYGIYHLRSDGKGKEYYWRVPIISNPVIYNKQKPVWNPYFLGFWLGNGSKYDSSITCHEDDVTELRKYFNETILKDYKNRENGHFFSFANVVPKLREIGVFKNKHIPEVYFTASVKERLALLQGLMDSDGTVEKHGQCSIMQKKKELADGIGRLLASLGIKYSIHEKEAKIYDKSYGIVYRITFWVDKSHSVFRLTRKTARLKDELSSRMKYKSIIDIVPIETVPSKCIAVDDKYHLFAVGERNTLTHNSELCSALLLTDFFIGGKGMDIVCSSNDDTQASILFDACDTMRQLIDPMSEDTWRNQKGLKCFINNNKIFKISERTRNREGRNIDTSVFDECFPPDVEILTHRGFIRFDELRDTDLVAEVNDDTFDFVKPIRIIKRRHEGELIGTTIGLNAKLFTTPNHNMVYVNTKTNEYEFVKAIDIPEKHYKLVKYNEKLNTFEYIDNSTQKECIPYSGDVYCVEVPSHKIIVKSDGIPMVCGNCHELQSGDIIKAIEQSQSLKPNPKFICITTEGFVNGGWLDQELVRARGILFNEIHDEASIRYLPWLYTQDSEAEIWQGNKTNRLWMKSNPSLGTVKRYDYLEQQIALARQNSTDRAFVLSKDFNVKQSNSEAWLLSEEIEYDTEFDPEEFRGSICLGAVDIAETTDLTCAKILLMKPDDSKKYIFSQYWIPQGKIDRGDLDIKAGARYLDWQKQGIVRITDGNYIDTTVIADWFYELYKTYGFRLYKCGYDVKFSTDFVKRMGDYGFDAELVYQSPTVMSQPMKMVEADIKDKLIIGNTEIDKWCFSNVSLQINAQGQGMAVKIDNMSSRKIDGAVTTIILYEIYRRYRLDFTNALEN